MKILWFASSPSNASVEFGYDHAGCGWISALETIIADAKEHDLGICFIYSGNEFKKIVKNNVVYYGIPSLKKNTIKRIIERQLAVIDDEFESTLYNKVLSDFEPDVIHVFGTENGYGKILVNKFQNVVFHLQGLVAPISKAYFPPSISKYKAFFKDSFQNMIRGLTYFHSYNIFNKSVQREIDIIKHWKYFSGRTHFDRNYVKLLNPTATYFHCEELLRPDFFSSEWEPPTINKTGIKKIVIGTTINPNIYKGLDLVYNVLPLLNEYEIEWNIFGVDENNNLNNIIKKIVNSKAKNERIHFHGQVSAAALVTGLKKCHFFVHPSYIDNSPNSVCEAMLIGMPVISSSVGGVKTLIVNEETGFLFNPYDRYDLAGLLAHLIDNYYLAISAGIKARQIGLQRHNSTEILSIINNMYNQIKSKKF